ncbi:MAG: ABC transporter ATP-binding protein [Phycisphaerales bacterium]|nr:ABC transporter ATP-binding protein [Phycisphaerales bacterium]
MTLLSVEQLVVDVQPPGTGTRVPIIQDVGFTLSAGETMALVGESGSGKSMTALAIMGLLPEPVVQRVSGRILLGDRELTNLSPREMASVRGTGIGMIFQEPMTALNPVYSIGEQVSEVLRHHRGMGHAEARIETIRLLGRVDLPDPAARYCAYPHEFSGGMRQRVLVAMAIAAKPSLVIADEPTTALDVRTQRGVLDLLQSLVIEDGMGLLLITHDMALVGERSDRLCVLCQGRICEMGPTREILEHPLHPYTRGLIQCTPTLHAVDSSLEAMAAALAHPDLSPLEGLGAANGRIPWWPLNMPGAAPEAGWKLLEVSSNRFVGVATP